MAVILKPYRANEEPDIVYRVIVEENEDGVDIFLTDHLGRNSQKLLAITTEGIIRYKLNEEFAEIFQVDEDRFINIL